METTSDNFNDHEYYLFDGSKIIFKDKKARELYEYCLKGVEEMYAHMKDFPQHSINETVFEKDKEELENKFKDIYNDFLIKYPINSVFYDCLGENNVSVFPFKLHINSEGLLDSVEMKFCYNGMYLEY